MKYLCLILYILMFVGFPGCSDSADTPGDGADPKTEEAFTPEEEENEGELTQ